MKIRGVCYDAGAYLWMNWRPRFVLEEVGREMQIIKEDLHCNAVRITARDHGRLKSSSEAALEAGLDVWYSPTLWDRGPEETLRHLERGAAIAESLRERWPDRDVVFVSGGELTLFMQGIVAGKSLSSRMSGPGLMEAVKSGAHNASLNGFLRRAKEGIRAAFRGKVSYASLVWEGVDWSLFDYVGVDHYRTEGMGERYLEMLKPSFSNGKPVVVTEVGFATTRSGIGGKGKGMLGSAGLEGNIVDSASQFFHYRLPLLGPARQAEAEGRVRPRRGVAGGDAERDAHAPRRSRGRGRLRFDLRVSDQPLQRRPAPRRRHGWDGAREVLRRGT